MGARSADLRACLARQGRANPTRGARADMAWSWWMRDRDRDQCMPSIDHPFLHIRRPSSPPIAWPPSQSSLTGTFPPFFSILPFSSCPSLHYRHYLLTFSHLFQGSSPIFAWIQNPSMYAFRGLRGKRTENEEREWEFKFLIITTFYLRISDWNLSAILLRDR